jgi:hypothetical protein
MSEERVRGRNLMRALELHALANRYRSQARVESDPAKLAELEALADHWEAKAREAEDEPQ